MKVPRNVLQLARIILLCCLKQIQYNKYMYYINTNVLSLNPLSPNNYQQQFSPNDIHTLS